MYALNRRLGTTILVYCTPVYVYCLHNRLSSSIASALPQDSVCHGSAVESYDVQYLLEAHPEKLTSLSSAAAHYTLRNLTSATRYQAKVKVKFKTLLGGGGGGKLCISCVCILCFV